MSQAKVNHVARAAKDPGPCGAHGCDVVLKKGDAYLWYKVGFRARTKNVRCVDHPPRASERESSMTADVYAAIESFEESIGNCANTEDVQAAVQEVSDAIREVAEAYRTASEDENGTVFSPDSAERADTLEGSADEIDGWEPSDSDEPTCSKHVESGADGDCDQCNELVGEWLAGIQEEASEAVNGVEIP